MRDDFVHPAPRRRTRDYRSQPEREQPYLSRPRPLPKPRLPIVRWIVLLLICLAIYNFGFSSRSLRTLFQARRDTQELTVHEAALITERDRLEQEREDLARGDAVEKHAREKLHYMYEDEEVYIEPRTDQVETED